MKALIIAATAAATLVATATIVSSKVRFGTGEHKLFVSLDVGFDPLVGSVTASTRKGTPPIIHVSPP